MLTRLRTLLLFLLSVAAAHAATLNVGPGQPYTTIQSAINAAANGDTVLVAPGSYNENIDFKGKAVTVTSSAGPATTIIDGGGRVRAAAVTFKSGELRSSVLSGFTVRNGGAGDSTIYGPQATGGVYIYGAAPVLTGNVITGNQCNGVRIVQGAALLQGNTVSSTLNGTLPCPTDGGAGLAVNGKSTVAGLRSIILGNLIERNVQGGGITLDSVDSAVVQSNILRYNTGVYAGGIRFYYTVDASILQNLIYGNTALDQSSLAAGGIYVADHSSAVFVNNTIADNVVMPYATSFPQPLSGDQLAYSAGTTVSFYNNIFSASGARAAVLCESLTGATFSHNDFYNSGGAAFAASPAAPTCASPIGTNGNVSVDPKYVSAALANYQLLQSSPLVDTGDNGPFPTLAAAGTPITYDINGNLRIQNATAAPSAIVDFGAYEYPGNPYQPSETLQSSLNPAQTTQSITFTATLAAPAGTPTGTVLFADGPVALSVQPISASGLAVYTTNTLAAGTHPITATYQPTGNFAASSASLAQIVTQATTATSLTCNPNPVMVNNNALLFASVTSPSGTPNGTVAFTDNGTPLAQPALVNGNASLTYIAGIPGTHTITATAQPTGAYAVSSASCNLVVDLRATTLALATSQTPSGVGLPVTFTATATYASQGTNLPGYGSVTFSDGTSTLGTVTVGSNLAATYTTASLAAGTHTITATLNPLGGFASSTASLAETITRLPSTAVLSTPSLALPAGAAIPLTATVTPGTPPGAGTPTGLVAFTVDGSATSLAATLSNGTATRSSATLNPGPHSVTCTYMGDASYNSAPCNTLSLNVAAGTSTTALTVSPSPAYQGQTVTLTARAVSAFFLPLTGNITFRDGSQPLGTVPVSAGGATFLTATLAAGTHTLTAEYSGESLNLPSTSAPVSELILQSDFSIYATPGSLTLATGHHTTFRLGSTATGNFTGALRLSVDRLPAHATLNLAQNTLILLPGGNGTTDAYLDTDDVLGYLSSADSQPTPRWPVAAALCLPLTLLFGRRRRFASLLFVLLAATALLTVTGCSGKYPASTAPGSYTLRITATAANGQSHTAEIPLQITP